MWAMERKYKVVRAVSAILAVYLLASAMADFLVFHQTADGICALVALALVILVPLVIWWAGLKLTLASILAWLLFIVLATYTGSRYDGYDYFWYDCLIHLYSGTLLALTTADLFFPQKVKHERFNLTFICFFSFTFAVAMAGFWEMLQYFFDIFTGADVQKNLVQEIGILGTPWQNPGVKDTMNDMINGTIGGGIGTLITFIKRKRHVSHS